MICTFGDTTDVIWWRELGLPVRSIVGRDGRIIQNPPQGVTANGAWSEIAGRTISQAQARMVELLDRVGRHGRRAEADHSSGEVLGERQPAARDRHELAVVHQVPTDRRAAGAWPRAQLVPRLHAGPLRELGQRPRGRLEHHSSALLRRALPHLVPGRRRRQRPIGRGRSLPTRLAFRSTRRPTRPTGTTSPARSARRVRRRPRRDGHVGDVVRVAADRLRLGRRPRPVRACVPDGHAAAGPRDHPHVALLHRRPRAHHARRPPVARRRDLGLRPRPRPQEALEVEGQHRGRSAHAAVDVRLRRGPVLGRERSAGHKTSRSTRTR